MKFNVNWIKNGFKKMKFWFSNVSVLILIGVDILVIGSLFGFPDIKFDVWRSKFHLCQIKGVNPFQV